MFNKKDFRYKNPFAEGFNGHAKKCDCTDCTNIRVKVFVLWYRAVSAELPVMEDSSKTIFVRSHWRRGRNHLNKMPHFKRALIRTFRSGGKPVVFKPLKAA